jgi:hypothetical protein
VSLLSSVISATSRLGRSNRCSAMWRLAGGLSSRRAKFLQLVSRAMVGLDLEAMQKITWRFEGMHLQDVVQCAVGTVQIRLKVEHVRGSSCGGSRYSTGAREDCCPAKGARLPHT